MSNVVPAMRSKVSDPIDCPMSVAGWKLIHRSVPYGRTLCSYLIFAALLFGPVTPLRASESPHFQAGQGAFDRGDFAGAYKIFYSLVKQQPGNPEFDFYLGRSAFEIGDYESATFAFERVLLAKPEADRARLELGRCYFELGDLESARSNFKQVLANNPPLPVRKNIQRYLERVDRAAVQHRLSGRLTLGVSYDDNINSSPVDAQIETILGRLTLSGAGATPQEDVISQNSLQLNHRYRRHPQGVGWLSSLLLYNASYADQQSLNLNLLGLSSGPVWQSGAWQTRLQAQFNYLTLDEQRYLSLAGLTAERTWLPSADISLGFVGQVSSLDYADSVRDATQYRLEIKPSRSWGKNRFSAAVGLELNQARDDQYSDLRKLLLLRYERQLPWQLSGEVVLRLYRSDYAEPEPLFREKRRDHFGELWLGLSRPLWKTADALQQIVGQLHYSYADVHSNVDLYQYNKQVVGFALSYQF